MEQNECDKRDKKEEKKLYNKTKIREGFLLGIGGFLPQLIGVVIGAWFGVFFGAPEAIKPINDRMETTYQESIDAAKKYELDGFEALVNKDFELAIQLFMASESSRHGYHASYEISRYLRMNRESVSEPGFWKKTYSDMINDERIRDYIPLDIRKKMDEYIRSHD